MPLLQSGQSSGDAAFQRRWLKLSLGEASAHFVQPFPPAAQPWTQQDDDDESQQVDKEIEFQHRIQFCGANLKPREYARRQTNLQLFMWGAPK